MKLETLFFLNLFKMDLVTGNKSLEMSAIFKSWEMCISAVGVGCGGEKGYSNCCQSKGR